MQAESWKISVRLTTRDSGCWTFKPFHRKPVNTFSADGLSGCCSSQSNIKTVAKLFFFFFVFSTCEMHVSWNKVCCAYESVWEKVGRRTCANSLAPMFLVIASYITIWGDWTFKSLWLCFAPAVKCADTLSHTFLFVIFTTFDTADKYWCLLVIYWPIWSMSSYLNISDFSWAPKFHKKRCVRNVLFNPWTMLRVHPPYFDIWHFNIWHREHIF